MITSLALMSVYGGPTVPLDKICEPLLGLSRQEAMRQAAAGELPVSVFRLSRSQKAPYLVSVEELARLIDETRERSANTWKRGQI